MIDFYMALLNGPPTLFSAVILGATAWWLCGMAFCVWSLICRR
jgi:hypothetical protein